MSLEFEPVKEGCFSFGVSNGAFFELLKIPEFAKVLGNPPLTNDPIEATENQARALAEILETWDPTEGWWGAGKEDAGKQMFIDFFKDCGGFTTY